MLKMGYSRDVGKSFCQTEYRLHVMISGSKCPVGWEERAGTNYCYKFVQTELTWDDARSQCQAEGADLASIITADEASFIQGWLIRNTFRSVQHSAKTFLLQ